jgi:hypothetical protein
MIPMSPYVFAAVFALASAALALWVDARFPKLAPEGLRSIVGHSLLAMLAMEAAAKVLGVAATGGDVARMLILLGLMLPALVYVFVVCVWTMKHFTNALHGSMR